MPKCLFLEMVLPQHTEELSLNARDIFCFDGENQFMYILTTEGGKGDEKG